ncbi:DBR1-domain-containing protein [Auriculariales sp. MPI-PUGE-AT-0066]|nr:DBR1-domain-containing protein [Auriculariales sp. MPI-PUGE-AT-0066]
MKVAVEGCCHGELDATYRYLAELEKKNGYTVNLLVITGDFQAVRNYLDLECMSVPVKYRREGDFQAYYNGVKVAPVPTIVIGGNHEASNYMWELYHGGWLAPNIYYLGAAGCVQVNGLRIAGSSGIYNEPHYRSGHYETVPYNSGSLRSAYHTREYDVLKLSMLTRPDIFLSHDWPQGIAHHGNLQGLLRKKSFFKADIDSGRLGSPPMMSLLRKLQPKFWFASHLHVKFEATVNHAASQGASLPDLVQQAAVEANPDEIVLDDFDDTAAPAPSDQPASTGTTSHSANPDEITIDDEEFDTSAPADLTPQFSSAPAPDRPISPSLERYTKFLALDKCLPKRSFLEVQDIRTPVPINGSTGPVLTFDPEWLAISRALHPFLSTSRAGLPLPSEETARGLVQRELDWVTANLGAQELKDVQEFVQTAPSPIQKNKNLRQPQWYTNPQTVSFCNLIGVENKVNPPPPAAN